VAIAAELNLGSDIPAGVKARVRAGLRYLRNVRGSVVKECAVAIRYEPRLADIVFSQPRGAANSP
jgi:hypothetical protein